MRSWLTFVPGDPADNKPALHDLDNSLVPSRDTTWPIVIYNDMVHRRILASLSLILLKVSSHAKGVDKTKF